MPHSSSRSTARISRQLTRQAAALLQELPIAERISFMAPIFRERFSMPTGPNDGRPFARSRQL